MMIRKICLPTDTLIMIVGWLGVVISLLGITISALCVGFAEQLSKWIISLTPEQEQMYKWIFTMAPKEVDEKDSTQDAVKLKTQLIIACSINVVLSSANLIASLCLILGTLKERHLLLLPWLVNSGIAFFVGFLYNVIMIPTIAEYELADGLALVVFTTLILALEVYIWLAIFSHFKKLQAKTHQQRQKLLPVVVATFPSYTKL